jgi:hypothetical protein
MHESLTVLIHLVVELAAPWCLRITVLFLIHGLNVVTV